MMKKQSLIELISNTEWAPLEKMKKGNSYPENTVSLCFLGKYKENNSATIVVAKFGSGIMEKIGWKKKDKVCIYNNPDNLLQMKIVKSDSKVGYSVMVNETFPHGGFQFSWPYSKVCPLEVRKRFTVAHEIFNRNILLIDANL